MCDLGRYGIRFDTSNSYHCKVEKFSNIYGMQLGLGGEYGNKFINIFLCELIRWNGGGEKLWSDGGIIWVSV